MPKVVAAARVVVARLCAARIVTGVLSLSALAVFSGHFLLTFIYLTPLNPVRLRHGNVVDGYMMVFFHQNWHLFAPNPLNVDYSLLGRCRDETGQEGVFFDLTETALRPLHRQRITAMSNRVALQTSLMRGLISGKRFRDPILDIYCASEEGQGTEYCERERGLQEEVKEVSARLLARVVTLACIEQSGRLPSHVYVRIAEVVFPRYSKRHMPNSEGSVSYADLGWQEGVAHAVSESTVF